MYGTASAGGTNNCGTIFSFTPATGSFVMLRSFTGAPDGCNPNAQLLQSSTASGGLSNIMIGSTYAGGANSGGPGTFFTFDIPQLTPTAAVVAAGAGAAAAAAAAAVPVAGSNNGTVFVLTIMRNFTFADGSGANGVVLAYGTASTLYGSCRYGGQSNGYG